MNIRQIEVFRALMLNGTVSAAAQFLKISQPGVSRLIHTLEDRTGVRLFSRVKGRLEPTREALMLYEEVERAYLGVERVRSFLGRLAKSQAGLVRIAAAHALAHTMVVDRLAGLRRSHPDVQLAIDFAPFNEMMSALLGGKFDFGVTITERAQPNLQHRRAGMLQFVLAVPRGHKLERRKAITPNDLVGEPMITYKRDSPIFGVLARHGMGSALDAGTVEVGSSLIACAAVERELGLAFVDEQTVRHERFRNISIVPVRQPIEIAVLVYFKRETLDSSIAAQVLDALCAKRR
jgi:DNA-binding transcriptional LysR family regulator